MDEPGPGTETLTPPGSGLSNKVGHAYLAYGEPVDLLSHLVLLSPLTGGGGLPPPCLQTGPAPQEERNQG